MRHIKIGSIKPHQLTKKNKQIWSKFMTSEYVYESDDGVQYVYIMFKKYDHHDQIWHIIKISEAQEKLNRATK